MALDDDGRVTEFVKSLPRVLSSKAQLDEEFVGQGCSLVLVYPYCEGGVGGVVVPGFANRTERPVDLEGSEPSKRGLSNLRTGRTRRSYR